MFEFLGPSIRHCDGVTRRSFLRAGALGVGGLTLADLLRAENGRGSSTKAVINIHLDGGPPQMDMIDPKPEAPAELRGEFNSIATKLPGIHLTELMPRMAAAADRFVFLRSLVGSAGRHDGFQCQSGYHNKELGGIGGRPALGCVADRLLGSNGDAPAFVDLMQGRPLARNSARPGFLGPAYKPFRPDISHLFKRELETGMKGELSRLGEDHQVNLKLFADLNAERLDDRVGLLQQFDGVRRATDKSGMMLAMDRFNQQAVAILTSGKLADALDLTKEHPKMLERYTPKIKFGGEQFYTAEGPTSARKLLMARRLVEAGVRVVSVSISDFDTHSKNFPRMRNLVPIVDHALAALEVDLRSRGLLDEVLVVAWGEFGRTPKVNSKGGRDHWPRVSPAIMFGGGIRTGQVIGATDKIAGECTERPIHYQDIIATMYQHLGLNPNEVTIMDTTGRPQYLCDTGRPVRELFS
ncbi:MAG: hypothetical protein CMO79_02840 [Verrucomicrobiales bacterium]|nr:hypothetical protein [Verrucomicrobiales bacterium]